MADLIDTTTTTPSGLDTPRVPGGKLRFAKVGDSRIAEHDGYRYTIMASGKTVSLHVDRIDGVCATGEAEAWDHRGRVTPLMRVAEIYREMFEQTGGGS